MAVWESVSVKASRAGLARRGREVASSEASTDEPDVSNRWHPRWTLGFIVLSCGLLWGSIFALTRVF